MNYFVTSKSFKMGFMSSLVLFFSIGISAIDVGVAVDEDIYNSIENRVSKMDYSELVSSRSSLKEEQNNLKVDQENTQSPAQNKAIGQRLSEITTELSWFKSILALTGGAYYLPLWRWSYVDNVLCYKIAGQNCNSW